MPTRTPAGQGSRPSQAWRRNRRGLDKMPAPSPVFHRNRRRRGGQADQHAEGLVHDLVDFSP